MPKTSFSGQETKGMHREMAGNMDGGDMIDQEKIGQYIAEKRKFLGMTQKQLAEKVGLTDKAVSKWERGKSMPDNGVLTAICASLHISVNELLSGEDIRPEEYADKAEENIVLLIEHQLSAAVEPDYAADKTVAWSSSDSDVATVDAEGKVFGVKEGTAVITASANNGEVTAECTVTVWIRSGDIRMEEQKIMFRLYNPNSGEHFYTASLEEKNYLASVGWTYEGGAWAAAEENSRPVYRLYNPNAGDHHYTTSEEERDNLVELGWNMEGIGWYSDENESVPLYRLYNPNATGAGAHHYTASEKERDDLMELGWNYEGIGWYGR